MGARLQRDQGARRQEQHAPQRRADRDRPLLGVLAAADLSRRRALGRQHAGARGDAERAPVRRGDASHGRRDDRHLRRQVPLQLLAAGHRDPQRRHRRQRCDRARCVVDAVHRHADAPRVSERAQHPRGRRRRGAASGDRRRRDAGTDDDQPHRERRGAALDEGRRLHAGGGERARLRRRALPLLDRGRPPPWANRSASWRRRSTSRCPNEPGHSSNTPGAEHHERTHRFQRPEEPPADGLGQRRLRRDRHHPADRRRAAGRSLRPALRRTRARRRGRQRQCHARRGAPRLQGDVDRLRGRAARPRRRTGDAQNGWT